MWIVTNKGFLSVVANRDEPNHFLIRARNKEAFDDYFDKEEIVEMKTSDYRFRVFVDSETLDKFTKFIMEKITYDNFKNSIKDKEVKKMATKIWSIAYSFQGDLYGSQKEEWHTTYRNYPARQYPSNPYYGQYTFDDIDGPLSHQDILDDYYYDEYDEEKDGCVDMLDAVLNDEEIGQFEEKYGMSLDEYLSGSEFKDK